jgi:hypothetical protein
MKTLDFNQPVTAYQLNESMFKKFGVRVNLDQYSREDLENYRNLIRTKLFQHEAKSNFNDLLTNEAYQKNKQIVTILNQKIKEIVGESRKTVTEKSKSEKQARTMAAAAHDPKFAKKVGIKQGVAKEFNKADKGTKQLSNAMKHKKNTKEGTEETNMNTRTMEAKKAKPDFLDMDKDGNKKEPMKKAIKDKKTTESLKGGQKKLDKNHNGKLDSDDFKKLRGEKKTDEGWDDMTKDVERRSKEEKGTGKFDKRERTLPGGMKATTYTRKPSTFDNGTEDKPTKKKTKESQHKRNVKTVNESIIRWLNEDEEGKAKSITAGTDMVNDFTSWMTRVGQYQTKSMIELADEIRANFGQEEAERFKQAVQPALDNALQALTQAREEISNSVAVLAGEAPAEAPMGMDQEMPGMEEPGMDDMGGDEFASADAAAGGAEMAGRERRESRELFARKLSESHNIMKSLSK